MHKAGLPFGRRVASKTTVVEPAYFFRLCNLKEPAYVGNTLFAQVVEFVL